MSDIVAYILGASRIDAHVDSQSVIGISSVGIQGPQGAQGLIGPPGPIGSSQVSTDSGNLAILGTDGQVLVDATHVTPAAIGAQTTLVSGTSIKTIDGISLLGSGNITTVKSHTELTNLQGGTTGEHYHLTATQLSEFLSFQTVVSITKSLTLTTEWADTGITWTDLATGTYIIQLYANDEGSGGTNNNEYYSGTMSWYAGNTVASAELPTDEITLHRAGNSGEGGLYLRTFRSNTSTTTEKLKLQIYSNSATPSASNYVFKFRRII